MDNQLRSQVQLFLHKKAIDSNASAEKVDMVHAMLNDDSKLYGNPNTWNADDQEKIN